MNYMSIDEISGYDSDEKEGFSDVSTDALLTFIIPTIGRPTLSRTLQSLMAQHETNWKAIVMFDGVEPTIPSPDKRITMMRMEKVGSYNHAGRVRNEAIRHATTEWIGFVDDDDTLTPDYMTHFQTHVKEQPDVIIFRMKLEERIVPATGLTSFHMNDVGISFCMKRALCTEFPFHPSGTEDFNLLDRLRSANKKIIMSTHLTYRVRDVAI